MQALLRAGTCHIVKLHAFYRSQDTAWLVLEYVFLQLRARLIVDPCNSSWSITVFLFYTHNMCPLLAVLYPNCTRTLFLCITQATPWATTGQGPWYIVQAASR